MTDKQAVIAKQSSSDALANPADIQIDFAENQPGAYNTAPGGSVGSATQPQNQAGRNPFENTPTNRSENDDDEDEGDLKLTE